jgi:GntP family gluconate:H+ symporter
MVEPMLPALGLDSGTGRALAAAATAAGSIALVHVNDPLFWIAASVGKLSPLRALGLITIGSAVVSVTALFALMALKFVL